jgi:hypothetical protein
MKMGTAASCFRETDSQARPAFLMPTVSLQSDPMLLELTALVSRAENVLERLDKYGLDFRSLYEIVCGM